MIRKLLAATLVGLLASPAWAGAPILGFIFSADRAVVDGVQAPAGTTVFDKDDIEVSEGGGLAAAFAGGGRVMFPGGTQARLSRRGHRIIVDLERGAATIAATAETPVEGTFADMRFRPAASGSSAGWIGLNKAGRVEVYAEKGDWLAETEHDGRSVLVRQGQHMEGLLTTATDWPTQQGADQEQPPKKNHKRKAAVLLIGASLGLGATGLGLSFGQSECTLTGAGLNPLPSCPQPPVVSPAVP